MKFYFIKHLHKHSPRHTRFFLVCLDTLEYKMVTKNYEGEWTKTQISTIERIVQIRGIELELEFETKEEAEKEVKLIMEILT